MKTPKRRAKAQPAPSQPKLGFGDRVRLRYSKRLGRIVELRGPLGPNGAQIYRVRLGKKPRRIYIEVREDQLELVEPAAARK